MNLVTIFGVIGYNGSLLNFGEILFAGAHENAKPAQAGFV